MAAHDEVVLSAELNKLKKDELVDLLIKQTLPERVTSSVLINFAKELSAGKVEKCQKCRENTAELLMSTDWDDSAETVISNTKILKMELHHVKEINKRSELIIENQAIAIKSLQTLNNVLSINSINYVNKTSQPELEQSPSMTTIRSQLDPNNKQKSMAKPATSKNLSANQTISNNSNLSDTTVSIPARNAGNNNRNLSSSQVSAAVYEATTRTKINEILALQGNQSQSRSNNWQQATGSKQEMYGGIRHNTKNRTIVGSAAVNINDAIQAAPIFRYFHVFRLDPSTTKENMLKFLKPLFPEVICEQLDSRHPNEYASFKIGVFEKNAKGFTDPTIWNEGIKIKPFFYKKKTDQQNN